MENKLTATVGRVFNLKALRPIKLVVTLKFNVSAKNDLGNDIKKLENIKPYYETLIINLALTELDELAKNLYYFTNSVTDHLYKVKVIDSKGNYSAFTEHN